VLEELAVTTDTGIAPVKQWRLGQVIGMSEPVPVLDQQQMLAK
jgi:hypothetical protein